MELINFNKLGFSLYFLKNMSLFLFISTQYKTAGFFSTTCSKVKYFFLTIPIESVTIQR